MLSKKHFQEYQFPGIYEFSEIREKLDVQYKENAATEINLPNKQHSLENDSQSEYRNSLAWDSAFFTSPGILEPEELFQNLNFRPSNRSEQEGTSSICQDNSRSSLAWDSAFFTSAGVLDPEELSMVNRGFKESKRNFIPDSEEKIWRSVESNSLTNNDVFSLASLEIGLLDDLKASFHNSSKTSNVVTSGSKMGRGNCLQSRHFLKKSDASSRVKMKSMTDSKKQILNTNKSERIANSTSLPPRAQHVVRGGNCNSLSSYKPPKVLDQVNSPSKSLIKRASLGTNHIKMENKATKDASGRHMNAAKTTCLEDSNIIMANSTSFSKSPSSVSHNSALSHFPGGSPLSSSLADSCSPSALRINSSLPSHLLSSFSSFHISPASSIDTIRFSESLASISQLSDDTTGKLDATPSREISFDSDTKASDSETHLSDRYCLRHENVSKIPKGSNSILKNVSTNIKPSGLRMPSPKIGFFDPENPMELTPNGDTRFHPGRVTGNNNGAANSIVLGKLQPTGTLQRTENLKLDSERNRVHCPDPAPLKEDKGTQRLMTNTKHMKNEGHDCRRAKKQKDARTHCSKKFWLRLYFMMKTRKTCAASITKLMEVNDFIQAEATTRNGSIKGFDSSLIGRCYLEHSQI